MEKLKSAIAAAQDIPIPTREEILNARIEANLEIKSREESLKRWQGQLRIQQTALEEEGARLAQLRKEHEAMVAQFQQWPAKPTAERCSGNARTTFTRAS